MNTDIKNYWFNKLPMEMEELNIYTDHYRTNEIDSEVLEYEFDDFVSNKLKKISKNNDLLLYIITLASFKVMIYKLYGSRYIPVISPLYQFMEEERLTDFVVLYDEISEDMTFKQVLNLVRDTVLDGYKNQNCDVIELFRDSGIHVDVNNIHKIIFSLANIHELSGLNEIMDSPHNDMSVQVSDDASSIVCKIRYNRKLFNETTIQGILSCYGYILYQVLTDVNVTISNLELTNLDDTDTNVSIAYGVEKLEVYTEQSIIKQFEERVEKTPNKVAISDIRDIHGTSNSTFTYTQLNNYSNRIGKILIENGIKKNDPVAILLDNTGEMAISILGVLKAGGCYVPIDIETSEERIKYILSDCQCKVLITGNEKSIDQYSVQKVININQLFEQEIESSNIEVYPSGDDIAYIIYTSGTTGNPKGVKIRHDGLTNFIDWRLNNYNYVENDITLQMISVAFDGFGANFYPSLLCGGQLVMIGQYVWRKYDHIARVIEKYKVTNMSITPLMYTKMLQTENIELGSLRFVVLAGERAEALLLKTSKDQYPNLVLVNEYGPTENTITTSRFNNMSEDELTNIGSPIQNNIVYIVNKENKLLPKEVLGELCISGVGITDGYVNDQDLTNKKVVRNPWLEGKKIYKTGDLAKITIDGHIELSGRIDNQVKIRGFRVEVEEIETQINNFLGGHYAIVVARDSGRGEKKLYAYILAQVEGEINRIRMHLAKVVPYYMIPTRFVIIDELPQSINGKIDRKHLATMNVIEEVDIEFVGPNTDTEKRLSEIWCSVLDIDKVGINESFFDVGGTSLLLMDVFSRVEIIFGHIVTMPDLFTYPTIYELANYIDSKMSQSSEQIKLRYNKLENSLQGSGNADKVSLSFDISGEVFNDTHVLCQRYNLNIEELMLQLFTYTIALTFDMNEIGIYSKFSSDARLDAHLVDIGVIDDITELVDHLTHRFINNNKHDVYDIVDINNIRATSDEGILILAYLKDQIDEYDELLDKFDLRLGLQVFDNALSFTCYFDTWKIGDTVAEELANRFAKLINIVVTRSCA
ncbi:hypothetical protein SH1V18_36730 [Vallitalea longa]|uniref:Carrier domain-containing protein n=1 Tax=Vallitalea longa TaxID=2936439 RepID=A0A9W5YF70_9FIRM|nr:amino acid adenylation domain-containing protein [Vallitalea longa]GKX31193.1 hypothetical protein SH1V18_36730 [Vallitalea longa]